MGSSQTRARTRVPCISRWILNHCATREAQPVRILVLIQGSSDLEKAGKQEAFFCLQPELQEPQDGNSWSREFGLDMMKDFLARNV